MDFTIAICFGQFGPYHHSRVAALQAAVRESGAGGMEHGAAAAKPSPSAPTVRIVPIQIAAATTTYEWKKGAGAGGTDKGCDGLQTLCAGAEEAASPVEVFFKARKLFKGKEVDVAFLPSYSPARYFALFAAAKSLGLRTVMMNESHAGTERATGWKRWIKRQIVRRFDAALVGGEPHRRHFAALGISPDKIFTGYDAVDNEYFAARAQEVRETVKPEAGDERWEMSGLPARYFLSLGRMVKKKNLETLLTAYRRYCDARRVASDEREGPVALVLVGSGEEEAALEAQARALGLKVIDRRNWKMGERMENRAAEPETESAPRQNCKLDPHGPAEKGRGMVFFHGFRQIEENPVFYALAEAFILPSLHEEWGLVVNEAMACSLPVIVSRTAGCAEDLVPAGGQVTGGESRVAGGESANGKLPTENALEQRSNGFVFDPKSVDALAAALARVAEMDGAERRRMGERSRAIVEGFSCENFARQAGAAAEAAAAQGRDGNGLWRSFNPWLKSLYDEAT